METLRKDIDAIDDRLLELLKDRQILAGQLGEMKRGLGLPIYDPKREGEILLRLNRHKGELTEKAILSAWREIFSSSRQAQLPLRAAYLGPEGTFTHQAALAQFGNAPELIATNTIAAAFNLFHNGTVDHAVLPVENTLQGIVGETVDLLGAVGKPYITGELTMPIHFVFSSVCEDLEKIETVYSKREAFPQCANFLNQPGLQNARHVPVGSTAEAALKAVEDPRGAALSPEIAANQAGIPVLYRNVENNAKNKTRFLVLGHNQLPPGPTGKTSIFARTQNVAGGLEELLGSFKRQRINLTKIESRPMDDAVNFETWFYIEFEGGRQDGSAEEVFRQHDLIWLGSYPRGALAH